MTSGLQVFLQAGFFLGYLNPIGSIEFYLVISKSFVVEPAFCFLRFIENQKVKTTYDFIL